MHRIVTFLYAVGSYLVFISAVLYAIGFVGNFGVPKSIDLQWVGSWQTSLWIDLGLLNLLTLQHYALGRPAFEKLLPIQYVQSTRLLVSGLAMALCFWQWRPTGGVLWRIENEVAEDLMLAGYLLGWLIVLWSARKDSPHLQFAGWLCVLWSTPYMSISHVLLASVASAYAWIAIEFDAADKAVLRRGYSGNKGRTDVVVTTAWSRS